MEKSLKELSELIAKQRIQSIDGALAKYVEGSIRLLEHQGKDITRYTLVNVSNPMEVTEDGARINMSWRIIPIDEVQNLPTYSEED